MSAIFLTVDYYVKYSDIQAIMSMTFEEVMRRWGKRHIVMLGSNGI